MQNEMLSTPCNRQKEHQRMKTTEQCLVQTRPGTAEREIEILRKEVADLASAFNGLYGLRLIRLFNLYRRMRHQITERLLRLARRKTISKQDAIDQVAIIPPVPGEELQGQAYDVVFMSCGDWQWRYQRPQHLANQWADHGHRVFFLSPEFRPQVNPAYMKPARPYTIRWVREAVFEVHLAGPRELLPRNKRMFASDLQKLIKACEALQRDFQIEAGVSVVELPFWAPLALTLRKQFGWKMIYDFIDRNYGVYPKAHSMIAQETELLREADLVVATARLLQDEARDYNSNILLIPNAAEVEHFAQAASGNLA
ncbi:MAG: hypothetical protein GWO08_23180, partial [Gammaproteobacteria bacterium]|nr:hypothetical protein [Gammaproteobacteria bacterium]NIX02649.1 hypothetical protein [Phycisphaerae bacterium]